MPDKLQQWHEVASDMLAEIHGLLPEKGKDYKVTFFARHESRPSMHLTLGNDDPEEAAKALADYRTWGTVETTNEGSRPVVSDARKGE